MKKSEFLRAAVRECLRPYFNSVNNAVIQDQVICSALDLYAKQLGTADARAVAEEIRRSIMRSIYGSSTVIGWLHDRLNWQPGYWPTNDEQYEYRLRWAEYMAQEYEAKGD